MAEITQTIPVFTGTVPDINAVSQAEFDAAAVPAAQHMLEDLPPALNTFGTQANSLRAEVNAARDEALASKDVALAGSNYLGEWSAQTGAVSKPASVSHNGDYYTLLNNLADITASQPGVSADWQYLSTFPEAPEDGAQYARKNAAWVKVAGGGDADRLEISATTQLAADSPRKLAISATTGGLRVNLPLASGLDQDGQLWIIANTGAFAFDVMDFDNHTLGAQMGTIAPNETRGFFLLDNVVGTWLVLDLLASSTAGRIGEAGYIIDPNTEYVFESATTDWISITALSDTKAIVAYYDGANSNYGTAVVLTISGTTITAGTPVVFESANISYISITALSDTKAIVTYMDTGNANYGTAVVLSISGTTITAGTPVVFESASTSYISITALSDTKAIVAYRDNGNANYGTAVVLTISGTTITAGTPAVFESATTSHISTTALSDTKAIVAYRDDGNSYFGTAVVLTISGTTITAGAPVVFESANTYSISITALSDTKAIVAYIDVGNANYGTAVVLTISGTTITAGTPVVFESANTSYISITALSDTKAIVAYTDDGNTDFGTAVVLGIDGTVITAGDPVIYNGASTEYNSIVPLSSLNAIVAYQDGGNANYGTAQILEVR